MAVTEEKQEKIAVAAEQLYDQQIKSAKPEWATFYRRVLGRHGLVYRAYPSIVDRSLFEKTDLYRRIQWMISELRKKAIPDEASQKDTKVITVRIPKALHEALADEARDYSTSVNKLCISKLLQFIDAERIPSPQREQTAEELAWMEDAMPNAHFPTPAIRPTNNAMPSEDGHSSHPEGHHAAATHTVHASHVADGHASHSKHDLKRKPTALSPMEEIED